MSYKDDLRQLTSKACLSKYQKELNSIWNLLRKEAEQGKTELLLLEDEAKTSGFLIEAVQNYLKLNGIKIEYLYEEVNFSWL